MAKRKEVVISEKKTGNGLFQKFGEFDSMEELNAKANELDQEQLQEFAKENGISEDMVEMFMQGILQVLVPDPMTAAIGKLDVEVAALSEKNMEVGNGIAEYLKQKAMEDDTLARAIRRKGKNLKQICEDVWKEASKRKKGNCAYIPPFEVFQMARAYYMKGESA